jgi:hypothetical protein
MGLSKRYFLKVSDGSTVSWPKATVRVFKTAVHAACGNGARVYGLDNPFIDFASEKSLRRWVNSGSLRAVERSATAIGSGKIVVTL